MMKFNRAFAALACAALAVSGCAGKPDAAPTTTAATSEAVPVTPSPSPSTPEGLTPHQLGEKVSFTDFDLTVDDIEAVESIPAEDAPTIRPGDGRTLWKITLTWTNRSTQAVQGCGAPESLIEAFDGEERQMAEVLESIHIVGNSCKDVLQGETVTSYIAFESVGDKFGWLAVDTFKEPTEFFASDPSVRLHTRPR